MLATVTSLAFSASLYRDENDSLLYLRQSMHEYTIQTQDQLQQCGLQMSVVFTSRPALRIVLRIVVRIEDCGEDCGLCRA